MKKKIAVLCTVLIFTGICFADTDFYYKGNLSFDYQQFPFGPFSGTYQVEGEIDTNFVDTFEGVGAFVITENDITYINLFAPRINLDLTLDMFMFYIETEGDLTPGTHTVSLDLTTMFAFIWKENLITYTPEYTFISTSGSIVITEVTDTTFSGTFGGFASDFIWATLIQISNGIFSVSLAGTNVNIDNEHIGIHGIAITNHPNPFNPSKTSTTISFSIPDDTRNPEISIYNIKGQKIRTFNCHPELACRGGAERRLVEGSVTWDGKDDTGIEQNSGIYFYELTLDEKVVAVRKMILIK